MNTWISMQPNRLPASRPANQSQTWQVNSARRSHGKMDGKRDGGRETAKQVDSLCCDLRDKWQRSEAGAQERVPILGHLQRCQPVFHGAHAAQVRGTAVQQGMVGRTADGRAQQQLLLCSNGKNAFMFHACVLTRGQCCWCRF